jgi:transcriptional regulator with PAS, ATPase and Fis domain
MEEVSTPVLLESSHSVGTRRRLGVFWLVGESLATFQVFAKERLLLGRAENAALRVESAGVSRRHAEVYRQGPIYAIRDLDSRNGTFVNGMRVQHRALSEGDVLRVGDMLGVVARMSSNFSQTELAAAAQRGLIGPQLADQVAELHRLAPTTLPLAMIGETGVGKERMARYVHALSGRAGSFIAVNCAALPVSLAEAELFGHRKGAFTGAEQSALGHFRTANGGTLLLDELADLELSIQAKLLRVLQDGEIMPLGESRSTTVDVRILVACQSPLPELVRNGRLRQDLAERLNGPSVTIPPLCERRADVGVLLQHFLDRHSGGRPPRLETRLFEHLLLMRWPGNVRELELCCRKLLALHGHEPVLRWKFLPEQERALTRIESNLLAPPRDTAIAAAHADRLRHDRRMLACELGRNGGNLAGAARAAGLSRQRAYRILNQRSVDEFLTAEQQSPNGDGHDS